MKYKKLVPSKPYETTSRELCDFCGSDLMVRSLGVHSDVTIEARIGDTYPEGDFRKVDTFDCCPRCWSAKVVPALQAIGGRVYSHDAEESRLRSMPWDTEVPQ